VLWLHCQKTAGLVYSTLRVGSVVIQLYAGECTPGVDRALLVPINRIDDMEEYKVVWVKIKL